MMRLATFVLVALAGATSCTDERAVTVMAAASLREAFEDLGRQLEAEHPGVKVRVSFAGSQELRTQIENGARADVFASADTKHMAALAKAGLALAPRTFARNEPVVIVLKGNPAGVRSLADLPKAKRLVIGVDNVPIGTYTLQILDKANAKLGTDFKDRVLARVVSRELNVRQVLAKVSLGEADAGVVYRTDAVTAADKVELVAIDADLNVTAEYPVAVLKEAPQPKLAQAFVDLLLSAEGQKRLAASGFVSPSGASGK
jgi:molybdate transport system substrate-binding protein